MNKNKEILINNSTNITIIIIINKNKEILINNSTNIKNTYSESANCISHFREVVPYFVFMESIVIVSVFSSPKISES